jgi:nitric-oxide synthase, bacterial
VFACLNDHLRASTNNGRIRLLLSVFPPTQPDQNGIRIWNSQLVRYAGYRLPDGTILGDPLTQSFTAVALKLGWQPPSPRTPYDILPLVIQMPGSPPAVFDLPADCVLQVPLSHPTNERFAELGLRWYSHPSISSHALEVGGLVYTAAPFSAWYTSSEIASRNLSDASRYNLLRIVANVFELNTSSDKTLWKDRALLELNVSVLHSFSLAGVTIVDHHFAAKQFAKFEDARRAAGQVTPGIWRSLIPAMSPSTTEIFHRIYDPIRPKPRFVKLNDPWMSDKFVSSL